MSAHLLLNLCMYFIVHNMYLCVYYQTCQQILQCNGYKAHFQHLANHKLRVYPDFNSSVRGSYNIPSIVSCSYICARDDGCLAFQYCEECDMQCVTVSLTLIAGVRLSSSTSGVVHELYVKGQYYFITIIHYKLYGDKQRLYFMLHYIHTNQLFLCHVEKQSGPILSHPKHFAVLLYLYAYTYV